MKIKIPEEWMSYGMEGSMWLVAVVLVNITVVNAVAGEPMRSIENGMWAFIAAVTALNMRRADRMNRESNKLAAEGAELAAKWTELNEHIRGGKEKAVIAAQGNCPKCEGNLATTISMRCVSCGSGYKLRATPAGMFLAEDEAASHDMIKH